MRLGMPIGVAVRLADINDKSTTAAAPCTFAIWGDGGFTKNCYVVGGCFPGPSPRLAQVLASKRHLQRQHRQVVLAKCLGGHGERVCNRDSDDEGDVDGDGDEANGEDDNDTVVFIKGLIVLTINR